MQHWTKIALNTVGVVKNKIKLDVISSSYMISTVRIPTTVLHHHHYNHQQVLILETSLWACSYTSHLLRMHRIQYNQWCYIYSGLLYNQMRTHIVSSPTQQLGQTEFPLAQSWASCRTRRAPNHAFMRCVQTYFNSGHLGFMLIKKNTPGEFDVIIRNLFLGTLMHSKMP